MHSHTHSFFSMLVHGNTFHSCGTPSVPRVPLLLFQQVVDRELQASTGSSIQSMFFFFFSAKCSPFVHRSVAGLLPCSLSSMASSHLKPFVFCFNPSILSTLFFHSLSSQRQILLFFSCRSSDRFALFIGELQAQAGIVDPIDGFFFMSTHFFADGIAVSLLLLWLVRRRGLRLFLSFVNSSIQSTSSCVLCHVDPIDNSSSSSLSYKLKLASSIQSVALLSFA